MANKKDYMEGWERYAIGGLLVFLLIIMGCFITILDSRLDKLEENEPIESVNNIRTCYSEQCYMDVKNNIQIGGCIMSEVDCKLFENKFALVSGDEQ